MLHSLFERAENNRISCGFESESYGISDREMEAHKNSLTEFITHLLSGVVSC